MQSVLWILDHSFHGLRRAPMLFAFKLRDTELGSDVLLFNYSFPSEIAGMGSFLNDFQVDAPGEYVYIADTSTIGGDPGLVVFHSKTQMSHRILSSHESMFGESVFFNIGQYRMKLPGPFGFRVNVDSIALDRVNGRWLYYGPMTSKFLYAVPVSAIHAFIKAKFETHSIMAVDLPATVFTVLSDKPITDGLTTDPTVLF